VWEITRCDGSELGERRGIHKHVRDTVTRQVFFDPMVYSKLFP
jgi:hypothetical protein